MVFIAFVIKFVLSGCNGSIHIFDWCSQSISTSAMSDRVEYVMVTLKSFTYLCAQFVGRPAVDLYVLQPNGIH